MIRPLSRTPGTQGGRESRPPRPHAEAPCSGPAQLAFWAEGGKHGGAGASQPLRRAEQRGVEGRGGAAHSLHRVCAGAMMDSFYGMSWAIVRWED